MENAEEIFNFLEEFSKRKPKPIPQELNDYLAYVARTGDPVYQWSLVKCLFKEKLLTVITDFYETTPGIEIPPYPNVDPFNYDIMKNSLIERLDSFTSAPYTVQRICELLTYPRKQYNRIDKFMRAVEKNILVVSTREPGSQRHLEPENEEPMDPVVNGSDNNSEYNVDVEMEDMSWKENNDTQQNSEPQPGSSDAHISVDDSETIVQNQEPPTAVNTQEKVNLQSESETVETNIELDSKEKETVQDSETQPDTTISLSDIKSSEDSSQASPVLDAEMKVEDAINPPVTIPDIKVDDAEMTEQRLNEENKESQNVEMNEKNESLETNIQPVSSDESSSDSNCKEENEVKLISEVSTSSEESSSSSDNNESNSNSPKLDVNTDVESALPDKKEENAPNESEKEKEDSADVQECKETVALAKMESDNYSISDVNSELPQAAEKENTDNKENESSMETVVEDSEKTESKQESVQESETTET